MKALKRLDDQARQLERTANGPSFEAVFAGERGASPALGGRSVFGWETEVAKTGQTRVNDCHCEEAKPTKQSRKQIAHSAV